MTLHDVSRLHAHWTRVPPLRIVVMAIAKAFGVSFEPEAAPKYMTDVEARRIIAMTGGRIDGVGQL